jgi:predicted membrane-bound spermidine synthase
MAFMFMEVTLIHKFILYLGHPVYSFSAILFSLLLSSGIGSFLSKKIIGANITNNLRWCFVLCSMFIFISFFIFPAIHENLLGVPFGYRIFLTFLAIFPIGFLMGFPFPSGIRLLAQAEKKWIPWAWAINAFSSVISSVAALMIAFIGGYSFVLFLAGAAYLSAPLFLNFASKVNSRS